MITPNDRDRALVTSLRAAPAGREFTLLLTDDQAAELVVEHRIRSFQEMVGDRVLVSTGEVQKTEAVLDRYHKLAGAYITLVGLLDERDTLMGSDLPDFTKIRELDRCITEARELVTRFSRE